MSSQGRGPWILVGAVLAGICSVALLTAIQSAKDPTPTPRDGVTETSEFGHPPLEDQARPESEFQQAAGNMWTGVDLYYGTRKTYCCEILGGGEVAHRGRTRDAVLVEYPDGHTEWKLRSAVREWYVKRDDPAIDAMVWYTY